MKHYCNRKSELKCGYLDVSHNNKRMTFMANRKPCLHRKGLQRLGKKAFKVYYDRFTGEKNV